MKTTIQEKTDLRTLGFTEITNLIVIKGGDEPGTGSTEVGERRGDDEQK